jgi:acyl-CoA synthetase
MTTGGQGDAPAANTLLTRLSAAQLAAFHGSGFWQDRTVYGLVRDHAARTPGKVAVRERARVVTYAELVVAADRFAAWARARGVRPGSRVAVWAPSRAETAVVYLACARDGFVCSPSLHRTHTVAEAGVLLARMDAAVLVTQSGFGADADRRDIRDEPGSPSCVVALEPPSEDPGPLLDGHLDGIPSGGVRTDPDTVSYLAFTSGSTGPPKGVMHSDNTLLAPVRALAADWSLDEGSVIYSLSPLSHNLGFGAMVLALTIGGEVVVHDLPREASLADRLRETRATFAVGVPTHAIDLLAELELDPRVALDDLRGMRISGAPVPPAVARGLLDHGVVPQSGYGMTEAGSHHYTRPDDDPDLIAGTSGRPCAGHEARIFSLEDADRPLPPGETGQIGGRGASLMLGYFDDQAATEAAFNADGWFLTGDVGWMDEEGYLRVTGRKKDLIIRGGHNIYPAPIENLAMQHAGVGGAAVIPVPDERLGERVCLVVTRGAGGGVEPGELLSHLESAGLSKFDLPEYVAEVDELPLLPSGKVSKRELTDWVRQGRLAPRPPRP